MPDILDMVIVGGGINGAGIARDATGRGLSVRLIEKGDLAGATSSVSSKLIHGGLRYLEYGAFRLVREALAEREVLLSIAPHLVRPLRFVLPHDRSLRPRVVLRLGLFLYDHLGGHRTLPGTETIRLRNHVYGHPLQQRLTTGFAYSDCFAQDSRLVIANARDATSRGATISTRTEMRNARRDGGHWRIEIKQGDAIEEILAHVLVNAAGPWAVDILHRAGIAHAAANLRLIKGSHIVVPQIYVGAQAYILQNDDGRVIFVIPYEDAFTLIGTTDIPFIGERDHVAIDPAEIEYLCRAASNWFAKPVLPNDVVWSYAGVRPLYDDHEADASAVTRDYVLEVDGDEKTAPMLSVFGGKLTTYRRLAEHALEKLAPFLPPLSKPWTATATLPGGDIPRGDVQVFSDMLTRDYPFLTAADAMRLTLSYGSESTRILQGARKAEDLGYAFGYGFSTRELEWLVDEEWARTTEDILWRRSKLGLHLDRTAIAAIDKSFAASQSLNGYSAQAHAS